MTLRLCNGCLEIQREMNVIIPTVRRLFLGNCLFIPGTPLVVYIYIICMLLVVGSYRHMLLVAISACTLLVLKVNDSHESWEYDEH